MAGIMVKNNSYLYTGEMKNATGGKVTNGILMKKDSAGLVMPGADEASKFELLEKTELYGVPAYRFRVNKLGETPYYFIENVFNGNDSEAYDYATFEIAADELLRAHPITVGEEFTVTKVTGSLTPATEYGVKTDGTIG